MLHDERGAGYALQQFVWIVLFTVRPELYAISGQSEPAIVGKSWGNAESMRS